MKRLIQSAAALALGLALSTAALAANGLAQLHGKNWPQSVDGFVTKGQCMQCHGDYAKLAELTKSLTPNPHRSHMGEVNCVECHQPDKLQPELMCNSCHKFKLPAKQ